MKLELQSLEVDKVAMPDLRELKELSEKLQLSPTRESVIQWHNNLEELQSEGIYPITSKSNEAREKGLSKILQQGTTDTKTVETEKKTRRGEEYNNEEEESRDVVSSQFPSVKLRNFKKKNKIKSNSIARRSVSLRTDRHGNVLPGEQKSSSEAVQFFRQRTPQYCQDRIQKYIASDEDPVEEGENDTTKEATLAERYQSISRAVEKIRRDLLDMRIQDNTLARQLLDGRHELNQIRAEKTWDEHANMLDDFSWELELEDDIKEQLRLFDLPSNLLRKPDSLLQSSSPLRVIGLSRMTMDSRRFSVI